MQRPGSPATRLEGAGLLLTPEQKRQLAQRVVNSKAFIRAPAMRAFLLYITEHLITGQAERLKEQSIGTEVLGRKPNYDPADDNIVRVRAHELRERLEKYFTTEGLDEPVVITVPKGTYVPEFSPRVVVPQDAPVEPPTARDIPPIQKKPQSRIRYWLLAMLFLLAIAASILFTRLALKSSKSSVRQSQAMQDFWGQFFDRPDEELRVVYADTSFALWQDVSGRDFDLGDYLSHKYLEMPEDKLRELAVRRSTSPADLTISVQLASLAQAFGGRVSPQYARDNSAGFFHHGNAVVIGSHRSNPWAEVFEPSLNFVVEKDSRTGAPLFRNRTPKPHEATTYAIPAILDADGAELKEIASYGLVALLKECAGGELVVLAEGLNMQATQAAGDTITDRQRLETLLRAIGHTTGEKVTPFEALIKIKSLPGGYEDPTVIAYRASSRGACQVW